MIDPTIELMNRRDVELADFSPGTIGPEIMKQGPSPDLKLGCVPMTVKEAGRSQPASHRFHMPVNHIAGSISLGEVKSQDKQVGFGGQFFNGLQGWARNGLASPGQKGSGLLTECLRVSGLVDVPDLLLDLRPDGLPAFFAAVPNFEKGVQETFDDGDGHKQSAPGFLGGSPAVGINGLWGIIRGNVLGFLLELTIGFGQGRFISVQSDGGPQDAIRSHRGGNIGFVPIEASVFFIG